MSCPSLRCINFWPPCHPQACYILLNFFPHMSVALGCTLHTQCAVARSMRRLPTFILAPASLIHTAHSLSAAFTHALPVTPAALTSPLPPSHNEEAASVLLNPHSPLSFPILTPNACAPTSHPECLSHLPFQLHPGLSAGGIFFKNRSHFAHSPCTPHRDRAPSATPPADHATAVHPLVHRITPPNPAGMPQTIATQS